MGFEREYGRFSSNFAVLARAYGEDLSNEFIVSGIVRRFTLQFDFALSLLAETLSYEGVAEAQSGSPRDILKAAYATYDFIDESVWLEMLQSGNTVMHLYDGEAALRQARKILDVYIPAFSQLDRDLRSRYGEELIQ